MQMTNNFHDKKVAENNLIKALDKLENNLERISLAINQNKTYLQQDSYQLLVNLMTPENPWERMLFNELMTMCYKLELKCHNSSIYFLKSFSSFAREFYRSEENLTYSKLMEDNQEEGRKYINLLLKHCYPATLSDVEDVIDKVSEDEVVATLTKEAIKLAGIEGNIVVEEGDVANSVVELQFGYNFAVDPFKGFVPQFGTWIKNNVKVLLLDGMIEKVSELDKILMKSFETKIPLLLIAQSFSEEVIATIYTNTSRGNFDVTPVRLQQSLDALNMLNDIAVVSGCDVVSTLKGEMVSFVDYDALPIVQKASITGKVLTIQNNSTRKNVIAHLNYLNTRRSEQLENAVVTDVADLTTKRIGNLLAHIVKITIPKKEAASRKSKIDNAIRVARSAFTYGFTDVSNVDVSSLNKFWQRAHKSMLGSQKNQKISSVCFYLACGFAADLATGYFTSAGAIISQQ